MPSFQLAPASVSPALTLRPLLWAEMSALRRLVPPAASRRPHRLRDVPARPLPCLTLDMLACLRSSRRWDKATLASKHGNVANCLTQTR